MPEPGQEALVRLDLNNPVIQVHLLTLQKLERHAKLRQMTWHQVYQGAGLKWEKIVSVKPPAAADGLCSLRISQTRRATAYREGSFIRLLTIAPDQDSAYGTK